MKTKTIKLKSHGKVEALGFRASDYAKELLEKITYTEGVDYEVVIIKGGEFADDERTTKNIRREAKRRGYLTPPAEVGVLLREKLTNEEIEEMGLWWVLTMHEPVEIGYPGLLGADRVGGDRWLGTGWGGPGVGWNREDGFAFLVPQVASVPLNLETRVAKLEQLVEGVRELLKDNKHYAKK